MARWLAQRRSLSGVTGLSELSLAASCTAKLPMVELSGCPLSTGRPVRCGGELGKKAVAAAAAEDMDASELAAQHLARGRRVRWRSARRGFQRSGARRAARCRGCPGWERWPAARELFVDARGHVAGEEQRFGIDVDDCGGSLQAAAALDEIFDGEGCGRLRPMLHALLEEPHAIDVGVEAESACGGALVGVSSVRAPAGVMMGAAMSVPMSDQVPEQM